LLDAALQPEGSGTVDPLLQVAIEVDAGPGADAEELDALTTQLQCELQELDLEAVERVRQGQAPPEARAVDVLALGTLLVTIARPVALSSAVEAVRCWLSGRSQRSVKLEIDGDVLEVTGLSTADQRALISAWLARNAGR
jgi:hypothetical protein